MVQTTLLRSGSSTMTRLLAFLLLASSFAGVAYGMDCSFGTSSNFVQQVLNTCPQPFESSENSFCCYDLEKERHYCCDAEEFAVKTGLRIILPVIVTVGIIISLIICCISCLCCSCCPWYRRRHQGTVYGKVQTPHVVHVLQTPANVPPSYSGQLPQSQYPPPYPTNSAGMPQPPPQYTTDAYAKQAPYNPNYVQA